MGGIIWLIVVIYIIVKCMNNSKKNNQPKANVPRQQPQRQQPQTPRKDSWGAYGQPQKKQQRPVKQTQKPAKKQQPAVNEILEKAKENSNYSRIREEHVHEEHGSDHTMGHEAELSNRPGVDDFDTYHLMDEVNDLIVKGYDGNLEFERDFLAEATDMLNRITVTPAE
jgi:hypothetical protein